MASFVALRRQNEAALRARYGAATAELHARLAHADPDERLRVAIHYRLPDLGVLSRLEPEARSPAVFASIATTVGPVASWLGESGFVEGYRSAGMPALYGAIRAGDLASILHDDRLARVEEDGPQPLREFAVKHAAAEHDVDNTWNYCSSCGGGNFGADVPVGLIEPCSGDAYGHNAFLPRGIYDGHEAFDRLTLGPSSERVTYQTPPATCDTDADCEVPTGCNNASPNSPRVICVDGACAGRHGSQVASVISSVEPGGFTSSASKIRLYVPNGQDIKSEDPIDDEKNLAAYGRHAQAFDWLHSASSGTVKTVNESHGHGGPQTNDWWSRYHGVLSVRAAGNDRSAEACPMTASSLCVGGTNHNETMFLGSSHLNPGGSDREEPDIVAFSGDDDVSADSFVRTLGYASASDWTGARSGTSYAAAITTSMVAHVRNACDGWGFVPPTAMRALFRQAAWSANPADDPYSTPNAGGPPLYDGAGWPSAFEIEWLCENGGDPWVTWIDLTRGADPPEGTDSTYTPGQPKPTGLTPQNYTPPHDLNEYPRKEAVLASVYLDVGYRIRATVAWEPCPTGDNKEAVNVDMDFDLLLYNADPNAKKYVYGSQSLDDNNEGFDELISAIDGAGEYHIILSWPKDQQEDCGSKDVPISFLWRGGPTPW